ncbi:MAG TPA: SDR family oxidoreductase [Actinomycetes bacterium]|nr:SDR family oxidoreductase [Actinomycetes bacterium]
MSRVAVVTGASAGLGRAVAEELARRGDAVALLARGQAGLDGAAEAVRSLGGRPLAVPTDVSDAAAVDRAAERVERELGEIDLWVNVASQSAFAWFWDVEPEEFAQVTAVTYLGYVYGTRAALARMRPRDRGTVVQVGSALAYRGIPLQAAYCGSKHAIQGFHDSLRAELFADGSNVRVTMVQMPALNTPQFDWVRSRLPRKAQPVAPIYQPEVAARAVAWAADHPQRREYWVGASTVGTLLANAVVPGLLDRYLGRTGVASQQAEQPEDPSRRDYLFRPVDDTDDHGAHGRFDSTAKSSSPQAALARHHGALAAAGGVAAVAGLAALRGRRRS